MQNKFKHLIMFMMAMFIVMPCARADDAYDAMAVVTDESDIVANMSDQDIAADMESANADAVAAYDMTGALFQQITTLEQEKVLMELEKERAQLDLELDRLAAEKIKLHMEIDTLSGRAEQQQQELENAQAKLEAEAAKLEREKEQLEAQAERMESAAAAPSASASGAETADTQPAVNFSKKYRLINVIGAGAQLQATIKDLDSGQNKTISVGRVIDGYTVQSISLDDGIVFTDGTDTQMLNVSMAD